MLRNLFHKFYLLLVASFALACIVFSISNREVVILSLYPLPWEIGLPLFLFGLICLFLGFLWGSGQGLFSRMRHYTEYRRERQRVEQLEVELAALKAERLHTTSSVNQTDILISTSSL